MPWPARWCGHADSMSLRRPRDQRAGLRSGPSPGPGGKPAGRSHPAMTPAEPPGYAGVKPGLPASVTNDAALVSAEPGFVTEVSVLNVTVARSRVSVNVV